MDLREQRFGIEIEMTGITRHRAALVLRDYFDTSINVGGGIYNRHTVPDGQGRNWCVVYDGSLECQKKENGRRVPATKDYSVELVSPICTYADIPTVQEIVRKLREAGAFPNSSAGVHIHVDAAPFTAQKLRNLVNIVASKEDMIYKALQVESCREREYCHKTDQEFLKKLNRLNPQSLSEFKRIWYDGEDGSHEHYHLSRYCACNLHSVFNKGTIEFRAFNSGDGSIKQSLHAGKIKAYIQFCLAITAQAYNQRSASPVRTISDNEKYTFRTWLLRLGLIGEEFKTARSHLLGHLEGNIAWRSPEQAVAQRERLRKLRELSEPRSEQENTPVYEETPACSPQEVPEEVFTMNM